MISVSEAAKQAIREALRDSGAEPNQGLCLKAGEASFELVTGTPGPFDTVVRHEGEVVLFYDQDTGEIVGDAVVDVDLGPNGAQLIMRRFSNNGTVE